MRLHQVIALDFPDLPRAACKGMDPLLFDLDLHPSGAAEAREACNRCVERSACREFAVRTGQTSMWWAGAPRRGNSHAPDPDLSDAVGERIAAGGSLHSIAAELGISFRRVLAFDNARRRRSR